MPGEQTCHTKKSSKNAISYLPSRIKKTTKIAINKMEKNKFINNPFKIFS
jgi:hypothetical protein